MSSTALARSTSQQSLARSTTTSTDSLPILNLTPRRQAPLPPTPSPRTPNAAHSTPNTTSGWLHPRMDEVIRRKNATNFDTRNMQAVLYSGLVLAFSFFVPHMLSGAYVATSSHICHVQQLIRLKASLSSGNNTSHPTPSTSSGLPASSSLQTQHSHANLSSSHKMLAKTSLLLPSSGNCSVSHL